MDRRRGARARPMLAGLAAVVALVSASPASADEALGRERRELAHDVPWDVGLTVGLGPVALATALAAPHLLPDTCRVCDTTGGTKRGLDGAARDFFVRPDPRPARVASDVVAFGAAPVLALSLETLAAADEERLREAPLDALLVAEATSAAMVVDGVLGIALAREKPWRAEIDDETRTTTTLGTRGLGSLPASHVTLAFALASSSGTIASLRGYRLAPLVWGGTMGLAVLTAYLRMAGDEAWLTDTLAGAGLGSAVGAMVPLVFHPPRTERPTWITAALSRAHPYVTGTPGGRVVGVTGSF